MTILEIKSIIDKLTYKPNWTFSIRYDEWFPEEFYIFIKCLNLPDSLNIETSNTSIGRANLLRLDHFKTKKQFLRYIQRHIEKIEKHELKEWLKYDGKNLEDPHPEKPEREILKWSEL